MNLIGLYFIIAGAIGELDSTPQHIEFDYHNLEKWKEKSASCSGINQSPINLDFKKFREVIDPTKIEFHQYENVPEKMNVVNNGHTLVLQGHWGDNEIPYISGGPLQSQYIFTQLHFHWGVNDQEGSEHTIHGKSFPLEMHMVHYKKDYDSFNNALDHTDGISVVAIQPDGSEGLTEILTNASKLVSPNSKVNLKPFALSKFDGISTAPKYASYYGSLTTPPCTEAVTWIFPVSVLDVSKYQMKTLRCINFKHEDLHNYRSIQKLNDRIIYLFKQPPD